MLVRLLSGLLFSIVAVQSTAETYQVTFTGTWNAADVSSSFPAGAHFTDMVGGTHLAGSALWAPGVLATPGIEDVAEEGDVSTLSSEVDAAILTGTVGTYIQIPSIDNLPGSSDRTFNIFQDKPEVSLISMVAPSPDWFVGVYGVSLYGQNGWIDTLTVDLIPWDAGTEDGNTFSLNNSDSNPHVAIAVPPDSPFIGSPVIGQVTFQRIASPAFDVNGDGEINAADLILLTNEVIKPD